MTLDQLSQAEQDAWVCYQLAQKIADKLNEEWSAAFTRYREEFERCPISACEWLARNGVEMFPENRPV